VLGAVMISKLNYGLAVEMDLELASNQGQFILNLLDTNSNILIYLFI
jgi:hypothetical protein